MTYFKTTVLGDQITFHRRVASKQGPEALRVQLHRTLRIPDDEKDYPLPPSLGRFPVRKVDDYQSKVPSEWVEHGGVFVPLYQREAMWLSFHAPGFRPVALKIAAGKVNAVSGKEWDETLRTLDRDGSDDPAQDYIVTPPQPWLDGFNTGAGVIRQFVSMPLGVGYTAEGQITGKEDTGGIQLLLFDSKEGRFPTERPRSFMRGAGGQHVNSTHSSTVLSSTSLDDGYATMDYMAMEQDAGAQEMGLAAGGKMKQKIYEDPYGLDTWDENRVARIFIHIINSQMWQQITGEAAPKTPISAKIYAQHGYPWFDLYDEDVKDVKASKALQGVKSVAQKDHDHGFKGQMENESFEVPDKNVKKEGVQKEPADPNEVRDGKW